jgi:CubicO group peptidase (beta-lactamase class C family)
MNPFALNALARSLTGPFAFCGIAVAGPKSDYVALSAQPELTVTDRTLFRVASVSKVVVGWTARMALARGRDGINPAYKDIRAEDVLGFPLRHPEAPDVPVTVGQLASHSAGLTDDAGYLVPPGVPLAAWMAEQGAAVWAPHLPGTRFSYCNLGYLLLAAVAEAETGERFDVLARRLVLDPLNIEGGFNWSGVLSERRGDKLPTYRRDVTGFVPQIDGHVAEGGISGPDGARMVTGDYVIGQDVARLSPQGGLRTSMRGMLALARALAKGPDRRLWTPDMGSIENPDGVFDSYGWGQQFLDKPSFYPRPLVGHFGNAYGFKGGIWWDKANQTAFAYALNGAPMGDDSDALHPAEKTIFETVGGLTL